jgi:uncharacterized protein YodC (DUF2158 family)
MKALTAGDEIRMRDGGRTAMVIQGQEGGKVWVAWDDAQSYPQSVAVEDLELTGHSATVDHVVWDPRKPERHGKRRSECGLIPGVRSVE